MPTLVQFIEESKWPIIITTSDIHDFKFSKLKSRCGLIELPSVAHESIYYLLCKVCDCENIIYDPIILKELAVQAEGDARAALNDLQLLCHDKQLDSLEYLGKRERELDILLALKNIFKLRETNKVISSFDDANIDLDEAVLWIDENLPREYLEHVDLERAYNSISISDIFQGRIRRRQYWRFLVYRNFFLTVGVSLAKDKEYLSYYTYKRSGRLLKMFWAKQKNMKKKSIAKKIAEKTHCSLKKTMKDTLSHIHFLYKQKQDITELELSKEEVEWLQYK